MERFYINTNQKNKNRLAYVLDILNDHPYCKGSKVEFSLTKKEPSKTIFYGSEEEGAELQIIAAKLIFEDYKGSLFINPYRHGDKTYYSIEETKKKEQEFFTKGKFGFDIFEMIFFHLSRYEELELDFQSFLGRKYEFEKSMLLVRDELEKVAVVDELIQGFLQILLGRDIELSKEPSLSHDIDYITKFHSPFSIIRKIAGHIRHRKTIAGFPYLFSTYWDYLLRGKDGFDTFDWMLSKLDLDKTLYFLVGGNHKEDNIYDLHGKVFQKALRLAKERNYHIGIHPSYETWNKEKLVREEKEKLESVVGEEIVRSRQHFLNFDIKETPEILQSLGIQEDSSIGYTRHVGYRCGTGYAYRLYDFKHEKAFDVVERPLVFMDVAWLFEGMRKGNLDLPDLDEYGGALNFHNSTFDEMGARKINMKEHYLKFF